MDSIMERDEGHSNLRLDMRHRLPYLLIAQPVAGCAIELPTAFQSSEKESSMDSHVMYHRGSTNGGQPRVKSSPGAMLIVAQGKSLPKWLAPVQLVAAALWHGVKAAW
jgi:hypothetical protein